jgi:hypothetical protein
MIRPIWFIVMSDAISCVGRWLMGLSDDDIFGRLSPLPLYPLAPSSPIRHDRGRLTNAISITLIAAITANLSII